MTQRAPCRECRSTELHTVSVDLDRSKGPRCRPTGLGAVSGGSLISTPPVLVGPPSLILTVPVHRTRAVHHRALCRRKYCPPSCVPTHCQCRSTEPHTVGAGPLGPVPSTTAHCAARSIVRRAACQQRFLTLCAETLARSLRRTRNPGRIGDGALKMVQPPTIICTITTSLLPAGAV